MIYLFSAATFCTSLIDGINRSEMRRRALILFCMTHLNENAKVILLPMSYKLISLFYLFIFGFPVGIVVDRYVQIVLYLL